MADANLLEILDRETKLEDMVVYGNVRCAIGKPSFLVTSNVVGGFFALVDVLALRCNGVDYFGRDGYQDSKHIYFSKGSMVIAIDDKSLIGKNVRVYGRTSNKGCTIKKQRTNNARDGIVAFAWAKDKGNWVIVPNKVIPLGGMTDVKGTVLEDYIVDLVSFKHPESTESIMEYMGVADAQVLEETKIVGGLDYSTEVVDLSKIPLNLTYRLQVAETSDSMDMVGEAVEELKKKNKAYAESCVTSIKEEFSEEYQNSNEDENIADIAYNIILNFIGSIASRYNIGLGNGSKVKGKDFVEDFLDNLSTVSFRSSNENKEEDKSDNLDTYKEIENLKRAVALDPNVLNPGVVRVPVLKDDFKYATMVIGCVTGVGVSSMVSAYNGANRYNGLGLDEWFWSLIRNPYLCGMLSSELSVCDCDNIFLSFSEGYDYDECLKYRDMMLVLDTIKNASSRSTLIQRRDLSNPYDYYPALGRRYIEDGGIPMKRDCRIAVSLMKGVELKGDLALFKRNIYVNKVLNELNELGLVEEVNGGYILARDLNKEYVIYSTLIKKGGEETGITKEQVVKTVEKFEKSRGFNLEVLQKDGIQLVTKKAGVLSGCAGSGKTTTSDCMVMAIEDALPKQKLRFGAPTGKAARRLAEVVGGDVKTIHSMFGLGLGGEPYLVKNVYTRKGKNDEGVVYAYFLDEMAMGNTSLMYEIVTHLNDDDFVYFLGDIKQLPPIGKGTPFKALMRFLPCVELGVSKRAAANGKINYNVGLINFVSDEKVVELQEGDDFEILPCADVDIQRTVVDTFRRMLEEFAEEDIQVVTGYQTDKYPWSTVNLNPLLQALLRNDNELLYMYNNNKFMVNDRVIHVKRNAYDMPRYRIAQGGVFEEVATSGVVNGELGKILGYRRSDECTIIPFVEPEGEDFEKLDDNLKEIIEKRRDLDIRDESKVRDEKTYFVVVQVYDVDLKEDVVVLYRAHYKEDDTFYGKTFTGGDLKYLDLAYALTTHKMQGSQSPCIIIPLGSSSSSSFMNRNMLNTMVTRASKKVCMIGSVKGRNSALTNGRRQTNVGDGEDVLGLLV